MTYIFTRRFLSKGDRTIDQMIQAARSGKQNIAEGSAAGSTSKESEIRARSLKNFKERALKLTNVAKASLQELLIDYEDFLRVRELEMIHQADVLLYRLIKRQKADYLRQGGIRNRCREPEANIGVLGVLRLTLPAIIKSTDFSFSGYSQATQTRSIYPAIPADMA